MPFSCEYCNRSFSRESTVAVHMCEPKRRRLSKQERGTQLGFHAYLRFYEITQGSARTKTFEDFCDSPYYRAFVRWGNYCINTKVIEPKDFLEWLLKNSKRIDAWASDTQYNQYLIWYLQNESVQSALARSIEWSNDWAELNDSVFRDCLRYGNHNVICHAIVSGRLSAWAVYNSASGQQWLAGLSEPLLAMIWPYINSDFWQQRFQRYPADQLYAQSVLEQAGW